MKKPLRIGTRGSPLALIQATDLKKSLLLAHPIIEITYDIEIVPIRTSGDWRPEQKDQRFIEMGGNKGFFTKEIEDALLGQQIDIAVHSMKDVASHLPDGLLIAAMLERNNPFDAFISPHYKTLADMPADSVVGTSSLRRQAQILYHRPDLRVVPLRGNVETRLMKLESGSADATLLAVAGLARLSLEHRITSIMQKEVMLPAGGQGAVGIEIRAEDMHLAEILGPLNHLPTYQCITAERAMLRVLDGNCTTPIGAFAEINAAGQLTLTGLLARPDGTETVNQSQTGTPNDAAQIGETLGARLRGLVPADFFAA